VRPIRARGRQTPVGPTRDATKCPRVLSSINRTTVFGDVVDVRGHVSLRYLGKLRSLHVGWSYRGQPIRPYVVVDHVNDVTEDGEVIEEIVLNLDRDYQLIVRSYST
jgi:hypothetical protein